MAPIGEHADPRERRESGSSPALAASRSPTATSPGIERAPPRPELWWEIAAFSALLIVPGVIGSARLRGLAWMEQLLPRLGADLAWSIVTGAAIACLALRCGMTRAELGLVGLRRVDLAWIAGLTVLSAGSNAVAGQSWLAADLPIDRAAGAAIADEGAAIRRAIAGLPWQRTLLFVAGTFAAAAYEEVLFRGYLLTRVRAASGSTGLAVVVSSAAFGAGHLNYEPWAVVAVALSGVLYAAGFLLTGRLAVVAIAHALGNLGYFFL